MTLIQRDSPRWAQMSLWLRSQKISQILTGFWPKRSVIPKNLKPFTWRPSVPEMGERWKEPNSRAASLQIERNFFLHEFQWSNHDLVVVSRMFGFHPYLGKISVCSRIVQGAIVCVLACFSDFASEDLFRWAPSQKLQKSIISFSWIRFSHWE